MIELRNLFQLQLHEVLTVYLNFFQFSDRFKKTIAGHGQHCGVAHDNRESGVNPEQSCCRDDGVFQVRKQPLG